jgi:hypothetical protein
MGSVENSNPRDLYGADEWIFVYLEHCCRRDIQLAQIYFQQNGAQTVRGNSIINAAAIDGRHPAESLDSRARGIDHAGGIQSPGNR